MSKRIVVGLDGSAYANTALSLAIRRAKLYGSTIIGVTVVDSPGIEQLAAGAQPGAMYISSSSMSSLLNEAKLRAEALIADFRETCNREAVIHEDIIFTGSAAEGLLDEGKTADLIITGLHTFFRYPLREDSHETLSALLQHPTCPVLAVPEAVELPQNVIIAYDGSAGAARALKAYAYISPDIPATYPVTLLCIDGDYEKYKFHLEKAALFLRSHGIEATILVRGGKPAETILTVAKEKQPSLVILGSPMYKGLSERLFGSVSEQIIHDGSVPVFVYH